MFKGTIANGDVKEMQTFKYLIRVMFKSKGLSQDPIFNLTNKNEDVKELNSYISMLFFHLFILNVLFWPVFDVNQSVLDK